MSEYKLINQGRTAEVFLYSKNFVLKLYRLAFPTQMIEREYKIGLILNKTKLGPKLIKKISYQNRVGLVYERVRGLPMIISLVKQPWQLVHYSNLLVETQFKINQQKNKNLPKLKDNLVNKISSTKLIDQETKNKIIADIYALPNKENICHGDFHPDNVILSPKGPIPVDWPNAAVGDPAADFTRTLILLKYGQLSEDKKLIEKLITAWCRKIILKVYKSKYQKLSGISDEEIKKWEGPIAAARLGELIPESEKTMLLKLVKSRLGE